MKKTILLPLLLGLAIAVQADDTNAPAWLTRPLSVADCVNIALTQNADILKAQSDLQASQGIVIQTRAVALPQLNGTSQVKHSEPQAIESFPFSPSAPNNNWNAGLQLVQTIYSGGKLVAAVKAASVTKRQAMDQYQTQVADTLTAVRLAYYDVLLAAQQITVNEASVNLLQKELDDQQRRFDAGTVPHFNVLRAEVAVANAKPELFHARSQYRIAKNALANLLGYNLPRAVLENIPLNLTDTFDLAPWNLGLPDAIQRALENRTELKDLREQVELQRLNVTTAKSGYQPTVQAFAGYNWENSQFTDPNNLDYTIHGWNAGGQLTWSIFDGALTYGKVKQAKATYQKTQTELDDRSRQIELDVRTAYSTFLEAQEVLDSQSKVQEQAEEALREANSRFDAGTGTQLDVLDAETSLTQARTTQVQAQHDYSAAHARLERAIGADLAIVK